ncbi:ATP phosphoribosyltransferase [Pycnococcus provasolii]
MIERDVLRMGIPSKGRMAEDTLDLLSSSQLSVKKLNPRQYAAKMPAMGDKMEVWFQRASDVVRKVRSGDFDIGILGYDMFAEFGEGADDLVVVHDALRFGECYLALAVPNYGATAGVNSLDELLAMPCWTEENPLRVVTGYQYLAKTFFENVGFENVALVAGDGALEAAPAMGSADIILDLVSTGTTLRENNLKEIEGGRVVESQGVLVANRKSLLERDGCLETVHEMLERLEAHLEAKKLFTVVANMRGSSAEDVASLVMSCDSLKGLQGPTVAPVYTPGADGKPEVNMYAVTICAQKATLYDSVKALRDIGGSGVLVSPLTYVFDEEPARWNLLLDELGMEHDPIRGKEKR